MRARKSPRSWGLSRGLFDGLVAGRPEGDWQQCAKCFAAFPEIHQERRQCRCDRRHTNRCTPGHQCFTNGVSTNIKIALLGYGLAGRHFHRPLIEATTGLKITAILTTDAERREQAAADLPAAEIVDSAAAIWARAGDFDLVVVAGANLTHLPFTIAALEHGLPAVVDKPLAATAADASAIRAAAQAAGKQVFPFQNRRWDSEFLTILDTAESLGRIHRFESHFDRFRTVPKGGWRELADPSVSGGVLLDFGAHLVDQAIQLLGPVVRVSAITRSVRVAEAADDDMLILLTHLDDAVSYLTGSMIAAFTEPRFNVLGTGGGMLLREYDTQETALRSGSTPPTPIGG